MFNFNFLFISLLLVISLITGCSSLDKSPALDDQVASELSWHWQAKGRLAIKTSQDNASGGFDWQQDGANYQIELSGPLGQGRVSIKGEPFYVQLVEGKEIQEAASPEILFANAGWQLPLSNLVYWLQGHPAPGKVDWLTRHQFSQDGWQVEWRKFTQLKQQTLPSLLLVSNEQLSLRLAVNQWQLVDSP